MIAIDTQLDKSDAVKMEPLKPHGGSLLGDLPTLTKEAAPAGAGKEKNKIKIKRGKVLECPEEFKCAHRRAREGEFTKPET